MIFKGAHRFSALGPDTTPDGCIRATIPETSPSGLHCCEAKAPWLMLTRTAKIKLLPLVRGCLFCKASAQKHIPGAHLVRNNWRRETLGDVGLQTKEPHHHQSNDADSSHSPPRKQSKTPNRIKGSPLRRTAAKSCNVNHLKNGGRQKGNTQLLLDNIKWATLATGDENNLGSTGFESVERGLHRHRHENALMKNG